MENPGRMVFKVSTFFFYRISGTCNVFRLIKMIQVIPCTLITYFINTIKNCIYIYHGGCYERFFTILSMVAIIELYCKKIKYIYTFHPFPHLKKMQYIIATSHYFLSIDSSIVISIYIYILFNSFSTICITTRL